MRNKNSEVPVHRNYLMRWRLAVLSGRKVQGGLGDADSGFLSVAGPRGCRDGPTTKRVDNTKLAHPVKSDKPWRSSTGIPLTLA